MITIDQMIERLQELREISRDGGDTPVVIRDFEHIYESAVADLMPATVHVTSEDGEPVTWEKKESQNALQVVRMF